MTSFTPSRRPVHYVVGIDIGGTNIVAGTVAEDGSELLGLVSEPTFPEQGAAAVMTRIVKLTRASMAAARGKEIAGVGIGSPGPLDTKTGVVLLTPNLGWTNFPLRDRITQALGLSATLDNDANSAIVGEIGPMTIDSTGRLCKCGNYGCLAAYASGPAIAARAVEGIRPGADTSLPKYVNGDLSKITAQVVYEAAHDGDEYAREVVKDTAKFLGAGVASIINIFNPEVVVVCGGVTLAGDRLFEPLRAEVRRRAFKPATDVCRIVPGELTGTAGVYGAAAVFIKRTWGRV